MPITGKFDLVKSALPRDYDIRRLKKYYEDAFRTDNEESRIGTALQACPDLDWGAYLRDNPDVAAANISPVVHFLKHGIFEGRKLRLRVSAQCRLQDTDPRPKISIVIPNRNHGDFLEYGLTLLRSQSLGDIEIIVVDDASGDGSLSMLQEMAKDDKRVRILAFRNRHGTHMARAAGVEAASGQYIMFMDADDYLVLNACEILWNAASPDFDVVAFNCALAGDRNLDSDQKESLIRYINLGDEGPDAGNAIFEKIFVQGAFSDLLWNKMYESGLCKSAFASMKRGYFVNSEDIYETLAIMWQAKNVKKIPDRLYVYRVPSNAATREMDEWNVEGSGQASLWNVIDDFLETGGNTRCRPFLASKFMAQATEALLHSRDPEAITRSFNYIASVFGPREYVAWLAEHYLYRWSAVANVFRSYMTAAQAADSPRRIGILYSAFAFGGAEKVIAELCRQLARHGREATVFLERPHQNDQYLPDSANVVYVPLDWYHQDHVVRHIYALRNALEKHPVDVMIASACWNRALLWQTILLKLSGVPVIMHNHMAFYDPLLTDAEAYGLKQHDSVLRCADKVICLSRYSEIYNHIMGINAQFIGNPVSVESCDQTSIKRNENRIVVIGQIGNKTKRVTDALRAIGEIARIRPRTEALFIGSLNSDEERREFNSLADELDIRANVHVTGWINDPLPLVASASILVSTAYQEAFPLTIAQAQALGLPCVMYELPIEVAADNPAIIQTPHGDYRAIARETLRLLENPARLEKLRAIAKAAMAKYSPEIFGKNICELLDSYRSFSRASYPACEDYKTVLRAMAFYAADPPPWLAK